MASDLSRVGSIERDIKQVLFVFILNWALF